MLWIKQTQKPILQEYPKNNQMKHGKTRLPFFITIGFIQNVTNLLHAPGNGITI